MNEQIEQRIAELYDDYVATSADSAGVKYADARAAIRDEVRAIVAAGERDIDTETDVVLSSVLSGLRDRRSRYMRKHLEYLLDGFTEDGTYTDPLLDQAFRLGDEHGIDKTLRHWTADDLQNLVITRFRVAADATAAVKEFDSTVQQVVDRMRVVGATHIGDVDWRSSADSAA